MDWFIDNLQLNISNTNKAEEIKTELRNKYGSKLDKLGVVSIDALSTAEYLYQQFINVESLDKGLDYSFISSIYFKALEAALNNVFYIPYIEKYREKITENSVKHYFLNKYSIPYFMEDKATQTFKNSLPLGVICYFLTPNSILNGNDSRYGFIYPYQLINHVKSITSIKGQSKIEDFLIFLGKSAYETKDYRNNAAHGTVSIDWETTKQNRNDVFIRDEIDKADNCRMLLNRLLEVLL
jgi:hypothetical protein